MKNDHHPPTQNWLEKQMGHKAQSVRTYAKLGGYCNFVSVDCCHLRSGLILDCWRIIDFQMFRRRWPRGSYNPDSVSGGRRTLRKLSLGWRLARIVSSVRNCEP